MIYACKEYQNDRQGKQKSHPWPILIFYLKLFGGKFKMSTSVSYYNTKSHIDLLIVHVMGVEMIRWMRRTWVHDQIWYFLAKKIARKFIVCILVNHYNTVPRRCRRGKSGVMLFPPWTARWGTWSTFEDLREGFGTQNCPDFTSGRSVPEDWPDFLSVRIHIFSLASFHESLWQRFNGFNQLQHPLLMVVKNIGTRPFNHGLGRVRTTSVTSFFSLVSFVAQLEMVVPTTALWLSLSICCKKYWYNGECPSCS